MQKLVESVMNPRLAKLLEQWGKVFPKAGSIADPLALFAEEAENLVIIGCDHIYSQYLHYGSALAERFGQDLTGKIIERVSPILDFAPRFELPQTPFPLLARLGYGFANQPATQPTGGSH